MAKGRHFAPPDKKLQRKRKSIVLSIVALLELALLVTSMTFSWFEGLSSLEMSGTQLQTASVLNSHVELGENSSSSDTKYSEIIDLSTFFDAQNEVRFSPVSSSDAETFYAAYSGEAGANGTKYRELTNEDKNANIIQFEFKISAPDGPTDVYLTEVLPTLDTQWKDYNTDEILNAFRFAFSDGHMTHILRTDDITDTKATDFATNQKAITSLNSDHTAKTATGSVESAQEYAYYTDHRTKLSNDAYVKPIFHIEEGDTKTFTMTVWLEAFDTNISMAPEPGTEISFGVKLCTSWSVPQKITVYDHTAKQWVDKVDEVQSSEARTLYIRNMDNKDNKRLYTLTYNASTHSWSGNVPKAFDNCELYWSKTANATPAVTWKVPNRKGATTLTILSNSEAVWGLDTTTVTQIHFRDYTPDSSLNNQEGGKNISMYVRFAYSGKFYTYLMHDTPTQDGNGKNSWSCFIPAEVQHLTFMRCSYENPNDVKQSWQANDRGSTTIFRATTKDNAAVADNKYYTLYVKVDSGLAANFYHSSDTPAVSLTHISNDSAMSTAKQSSGGITSIKRKAYSPVLDTWPEKYNELNKLEDNLYYIVLDANKSSVAQPAAGTSLTVWNKNVSDRVYIDEDIYFGQIESYSRSFNTILLKSRDSLSGKDADNNYILNTSLTTTSDSVGKITSGTRGKGEWISVDHVVPTGYTTTFVHTTAANRVTVSFVYQDFTYYFNMTKGSNNKWTTDRIPEFISNAEKITFIDDKGNTWTDTTGKTETNCYFYATKTSGAASQGFWSAQIKNTSYFKHYNTSVSSVTATFTYNGQSVTVDFTKGSDNLTWSAASIPDSVTSVSYSDGTNTWSMTNRNASSTPYCYALGKNNAKYGAANLVRIYSTNNKNWGTNKIYYWGGFATVNWPGDTLTSIGKNDQSQTVFCGLVPNNSTGIILYGKLSGSDVQTVDITSNIVDMKGFYISGGSGKSYTVGTWDVDPNALR